MESLTHPGTIFSMAALITALGGTWHVNSRVNELDESIKGLTDKMAKMIHKSVQDTDSIRNISQLATKHESDITQLSENIKILVQLKKNEENSILRLTRAINELQKFIQDNIEIEAGTQVTFDNVITEKN